jgi:hypothetical protein
VRLSQEGQPANLKIDTTEGVRSCSTVSLSPAIPKAAPVTKVRAGDNASSRMEFGEAVPSDAKERQRLD